MSFAFEAIGTHWNIIIQDEISDHARSDIFKSIQNRINEFDKNYSRFREDSLVTTMSKQCGVFTLPCDAEPLFDLYEKMYRFTEGMMTPLIGRLLEETGYDANYSFQTKTLHTPPAWNEAIEYTFPAITIKQPVLLDVGAAGKGYLVDLIGELLRAQGVQSFSINAGGDILHGDIGGVPIRVALEHPKDTESAIGVAHILNESICGSSGNRRVWGKYHHILNPHTQESPRHIAAVWMIAKTALIADALTTALYFVEPEKLETEFLFEYLVMFKDATVNKSNGFNAELFC